MMIRRLISFTLVVALLSSLVSPVMAVAHLCAGTAAVAESLRQAAEHEHHHDHGHHHHGSVTSHHDHHDHDATVQAEEHDHGSLPISGASICCWDDVSTAQAHLDTPTLTTVKGHTVVLLAIATIAQIIAPSTLPVHAWDVSFKIGSSPPYLATTSRHTYLLTSSFLI